MDNRPEDGYPGCSSSYGAKQDGASGQVFDFSCPFVVVGHDQVGQVFDGRVHAFRRRHETDGQGENTPAGSGKTGKPPGPGDGGGGD